MLALQLGKLILLQRQAQGMLQSDLARRAGVSRTVLSGLERGQARAVQTDIVDRILAALDCPPALVPGGRVGERNARLAARAQQQAQLDRRRAHHYRLAAHLATDQKGARTLVKLAQNQVKLWRRQQTCSAHYTRRWSSLLRLPPKELAQKMLTLGSWEDALFQNSPWRAA